MIATSLLVFSMLFQPSGAAPGQEVLTNSQVVRLVEAGLPADLVVEKIRKSACRFATDTDALVDLAKHKVPEPVLRAMLAAPVAAAPSAAATPAAAPPAAAPPAAAPSAAPAAPLSAPRMAITHDVEWKGGKAGPCLGELVFTYEGFEFQPAAAGCTELLRIRWSSVRRYCFLPSRVLGSAEVSFVGREKGGRWAFSATTRASSADLGSSVDALRKSSVEVPETCQ